MSKLVVLDNNKNIVKVLENQWDGFLYSLVFQTNERCFVVNEKGDIPITRGISFEEAKNIVIGG